VTLNKEGFDTPIVFMVFNRPDCTQRVFEEIRKIRPKTLLVIADGHRKSKPGEELLCRETREIIEKGVDWPCQVMRNYADENMGCGLRVSSGLSWAFSKVEEAIILEDDCLPSPQFFDYTKELLERYRNNRNIGMIGGFRYHPRHVMDNASYHFSSYCQIWGWASWARAWEKYDFNADWWPEFRDSREFRKSFISRITFRNLQSQIDSAFRRELDTWDLQWMATCMRHGMLTIVPSKSLIENIGWGDDATHSKKAGRYTGLGYEVMEFPLNHPSEVERSRRLDRITEKIIFTPRLRSRLKRCLIEVKWSICKKLFP